MSQQVAPPSPQEQSYIGVMSRSKVVQAYSAWADWTEAERVSLEFALRDNMTVLDLGCGAGRFASVGAGRRASYLGIDASAAMIAVARRRHPESRFLVGDVVTHSLDSSSWDLILLMGNVLDALHPYERRRHMLQRCRQLLPRGGRIVCSSHLVNDRKGPGYYLEDYHGGHLLNYQGTMPHLVGEAEESGFEVELAVRDYRDSVAHWMYWVGR